MRGSLNEDSGLEKLLMNVHMDLLANTFNSYGHTEKYNYYRAYTDTET